MGAMSRSLREQPTFRTLKIAPLRRAPCTHAPNADTTKLPEVATFALAAGYAVNRGLPVLRGHSGAANRVAPLEAGRRARVLNE